MKSSLEVILSGYGVYGIVGLMFLVLSMNVYKYISKTGLFKKFRNSNRAYLLLIALISTISAVLLLLNSVIYPVKTFFAGFVLFIPCMILSGRSLFIVFSMPDEDLDAYMKKNFWFDPNRKI